MIVFRKAHTGDRSLFERWLAEDAFHQSVGVRIEDVYAPGTELVVVEDSLGPLMAVRLAIKNDFLHIGVQFNPATPFRSAKAGRAVRDWASRLAKHCGLKGVTAKPGGQAIPFVKRLGFVAAEGDTFVYVAE